MTQNEIRLLARGVFVSFLFLATAAAAEVSLSSLVQRLGDRDEIADFRDSTSHLFSSADPKGSNIDYGHFLQMEGEDAVVAEMIGPGAITRIWSANPSITGNIRIYLDDQATPVIDVPFVELFRGKNPPFTAPYAFESSGGFTSYLPIPYAKKCKVVIERPTDKLFYQLGYISFPQGTRVQSFRQPLTNEETRTLQQTALSWSQRPQIIDNELRALPPKILAIPARETAVLSEIAGPGRVRSFAVQIPTAPSLVPELRKLVLRAYFDGHQQPDIETPLADLFGNAFRRGTQGTVSLFTGKTSDDFLTFSLPMPFGRSARFTLENGTDQVLPLTYKIDFHPGTFNPQATGYLHARYAQENVHPGQSYRWLNLQSDRGHFVGAVQTMVGENLLFLEGDETFRVDDEKFTPRPGTRVAPWMGTGTEDYYNSGWYFLGGHFARPTHGAVVREDGGQIGVYRWHLLDTINFHHSIDAEIEHGAVNDADGSAYSSVVFWYSGKEAPAREKRMPKARQLVAADDIIFPPNNRWVLERAAPGLRVAEWDEFNVSHVAGRVLIGEPKTALRIPLHVRVADEYRLRLFAAKAERFTQLDVSIEGSPFHRSFSLHTKGPGINPAVLDFGVVSLPVGTHILVIDSPNGFAMSGVAFESSTPLQNGWQISPAYPHPDQVDSLDHVFAPESFLRKPWVSPIRWQNISPNLQGWYDLNKTSFSQDQATVYAYLRISSSHEFDTHFLLGSDDGALLWLNGQLVHRSQPFRSMMIDGDIVPIHIEMGENVFVLKIMNGKGGWSFAARILDPQRWIQVVEAP